MTVYSLCDLTGNMVRPWAESGHDCVCFDLQHSIRTDRVDAIGTGTITYRWADVRSLTPADLPSAAIVFAFPPCTDLAVSGARDFARKGLRRFIDALELVEACRLLAEFSGAPWMLENPVSRLASAWRAPDFTFNPSDFGEPYTKRTCLWTGGGFVVPQIANPVVATDGSRMHKLPPSADRANMRSATPMGFARAVFDANAPWVRRERAA